MLIYIFYIILLKLCVSSSYQLHYFNDDNFKDVSSCKDTLEDFSGSASDFTLCSILHAQPIKLCERCVEEYVEFTRNYQTLVTSSFNGSSCRELYISHDKLDVVLNYFQNIKAVWDRAYCDNCFEWKNNTPTISNDTKQFIKSYDKTMKCINNNNRGTNSSEVVCKVCMDDYMQLNSDYEAMSGGKGVTDGVCMDVVDAMNATRTVWSVQFDCCKFRRHSEIVFLCCSCLFSMLPLIFYLLSRYFIPKKDLPRILKLNRFKEKFLRQQDAPSTSTDYSICRNYNI